MTTPARQPAPARPAFTLTELLVAIGVIALLSTLTVFSVKALSRDARLASGRNVVAVVLSNARALALKNNQPVMVAFRPVMQDDGRLEIVQAVTAKWTGESGVVMVNFGGGPTPQVVDRFVPVPNVPPRPLPRGIKVAGPLYSGGQDSRWVTQSHFPKIVAGADAGETRGLLICVIFAGDGTVITHNPQSDSVHEWIDFNDDRWQCLNDRSIAYGGIPAPPFDVPPCGPAFDATAGGALTTAEFNNEFFFHWQPAQEPYVDAVPFLAVYDDDQARQAMGDLDWRSPDGYPQAGQAYQTELQDNDSGFIGRNADRIHFNRYTGVVMK